MTNEMFGVWRQRIGRRELLQGAGLAAAGFLVGCSTDGGGLGGATETTTAPSGTSPGTTVAGQIGGERVPAVTSVYDSGLFWDETMRKFSGDWQQLGIEFRPVPVSQTEWLDAIFERRYGDVQAHLSPVRPERFDPTEWLVSRAYGPEGVVGQRNYGNYKSRAYDAAVERVLVEGDESTRQQAAFDAQVILREDYYTQCLVFQQLGEAYNADDWAPQIEPIVGNGLLGDLLPYGLLSVQPTGERTRFVRGVVNLLDTTNVVATTGTGRNILRLVYDTLVKLDTDLSVRSWAAEEWRQVDDVTWDVRLRPGMQFHDGVPVTAEDVRWTFQTLIDQEPGILSLVWDSIESVEVYDEDEEIVRFVLKEPRADFLTITLVIGFILPKHIWDTGELLVDQVVDTPEKAVGSGPFRWVDYRRDDQLLLAANPDHFFPPEMSELLYLVSPTVDGNVGRLQQREIDWMDAGTAGILSQAGSFPHVETVTTESLGWWMVLPFVERMPWRDIEFRRAWAHAIDREYCSEVILEGLAVPSESGQFLAPFGFWGHPDLEPIEFDLERARQILEDAGYSWDGEGRLVYPPADDPDFRDRIEKVLSRDDDWWGPGPDEVGPPDGRV